MNLYKALSDDYRSYQLREAEKLVKSKRLNSKVLKESISKKNRFAKSLKEAVNVNVSSEDGDINVSLEGSNVTVDATTKCDTPVCAEPVVEEVPEEPVVEEVPEVSEVPEVPEDSPVEPEEDDAELKETAEDIDEFWAKGFKPGDKIQSSGAGEVEILDLDKGADYILIKRPIKRPTTNIEYVAAWAPSLNAEGKLYWGQGHYFDDEESARDYFNSKKSGSLSEGCGSKRRPRKERPKTKVEEADVVIKNPKKGDIEGQGYANALDKVAKELFKGKWVKPEVVFSDSGLPHVEYEFDTDLGKMPDGESKHLCLAVTDVPVGAPVDAEGTKRYLCVSYVDPADEDDDGEPQLVKAFDGNTPIAKLEPLFKDIITHSAVYKEIMSDINKLDDQIQYRADKGIRDSEELKECEVRSFRITRISPSSGIYMIEADNSKNERSYIVGKNFNTKTNTLDEAEIFADRSKANNKFKEMLVSSNKKGE